MNNAHDNPLLSVASEEALRSLHILADAMPQIVWTAGADGAVDYFNQRWYDYSGRTPAESLGADWRQALHPDDLQNSDACWAESVRTGDPFEAEYRFRRAADGRYRWHLGRAQAVRNADGEIVYWIGACTDIDDQKRAAERENLVNRIGLAIRGTLDPETICLNAATILGEALGADRCFFVSYGLSADSVIVGQEWHGDTMHSLAGEYRSSDFEILLEGLFTGSSTLTIADIEAAELPETCAFVLQQFHLRALLCVPMHDRGALVSSLILAMEGSPREWTADEVMLTEQVATLIRSAMTLARVHQRERRISTTLQGVLQPSIPDSIPGLDLASYYLAALDEANVGGDFSDVFPVEKGCHALVVGDLSGKGLEAASQVATVRNMLRFALYTGNTVSEAITRLNNILIANNLLSGFATLVVVTYDVNLQTITYVSCGQEPALLRRTADGRVEELPPTGPILGVSETSVYREEIVTLKSGDTFALYTDGLTEAGPSRREMLGVSGLAELLRHGAQEAQTLVRQMVQGAEEHAHGIFRDDVCLLVGIVNATGIQETGQ